MHSQSESLSLSRSPEELRQAFERLLEPRNVATLLDVTYETLVYYLYELRDGRYRTFNIAKRRGGVRTIAEPKPGLKAIQQKLSQVLDAVYWVKPSVHGFQSGRSIATNAQLHEASNYVLNIDIQDFFPSINFGRVRGLFMAAPHKLPPSVATVLAQICCFQNKLPQGAPTSPIVSNMISSRMDTALQKLARRHRCLYSRYADDITFSTKRARFPKSLAAIDQESGQVVLGGALESVVHDNGFKVNQLKVRLQSPDQRQEVTGLVVNREANVPRVFVRQIRAMLHAWEKHGYEAAEREFQAKYDKRNRAPFKESLRFREVVKGKIDFVGMVKGKDHAVYERLLEHYARLQPNYRRRPHGFERPNHLRRFREGIWVLECDTTFDQGTAFFLKGVGVVTCSHVIGLQTRAFRPERPDVRFNIRVLARSRETDLAILEIEGASGYELEPLRGRDAGIGETVRIAGFPNWIRGSSLWEVSGTVAGRHNYFGQPCYRVSCSIVTGASGAPVFDGYRRVIGVAARGTPTVEAGTESAEHGVIPIARVYELATSAGILPIVPRTDEA